MSENSLRWSQPLVRCTLLAYSLRVNEDNLQITYVTVSLSIRLQSESFLAADALGDSGKKRVRGLRIERVSLITPCVFLLRSSGESRTVDVSGIPPKSEIKCVLRS